LSASVTLLRSEPLCVERDTEDQLGRREAERDVLVNGTGRTLDRDMVSGVVVPTVHEIVRHDLEELADPPNRYGGELTLT
jgi:chemotaxis signal transduction protein